MPFAGRRRELQEIGRLLERAAGGAGGLLAITGPPGSGKTALAETAAAAAGNRGFEVLRADPPEGQPGRLVWAQLLRDVKAPENLVTRLSGTDAGPLDLDAAARHLSSPGPRLVLIDDVDRGGPDAAAVLAVVAARCAASATAVIVTTSVPLGLRTELRIAGLSQADLAAASQVSDEDTARALWMASRGLPGVALPLARELTQGQDPVVHLALRATPTARFLDVDQNLIRLLELAAERPSDDATHARILARLARELLGDASAGSRRRALADEALRLARRVGDPGTLAVVLDARLYALWDPDGAQDRLAAGAEIITLARTAGDDRRERQGRFWRFVALMELGRVAEAESALAAYAREAAAAGDAEAAVTVTARHAMLAVLRGRFDEAVRLTGEVAEAARRIKLPDAEAITGTLAGLVMAERGTLAEAESGVAYLLTAAVRQPGHLFEATAARILTEIGRTAEAAAELERLLPRALAASGPRWVGALADLSLVAARTGHADAASRLAAALAPYRGRLVVWGGANSAWGPVSHYLGLLAAATGQAGAAIGYFEEAIELEEQIGALPYLAHSLHGLAAALTARAGPGDAGRAAQAQGRARDIAERLGLTHLLDRLARPASEWSLTRDGDDWVLEAGGERARLRDGRGLHYLRALLAAPGRDIPALDLAAGGAGLTAAGTEPVLDAVARDAYRRRLDALAAEADAADRAGDGAAATRLETERQALVGELSRAAGLAGRNRLASLENERARVNVTRTLRAAIERIAPAAPGAAAHLRASVRTGLACRYDPAPGGPSRWHV
ncbi:MAG TPA: AAA family ATPase [Streptosporangiaceae bacterium]|nr:AAA family ATPase [Streptosporangiaceae bacterium]